MGIRILTNMVRIIWDTLYETELNFKSIQSVFIRNYYVSGTALSFRNTEINKTQSLPLKELTF